MKAPTIEPCGVCDACREIAAGISLDVLEIDGASNNGVEQVRELRDNVRYAPTRGAYKIYIIDEVHMLTSAAFNALLKTLEEPPEHVKFIFATTEPQKVLPTILSRCQRFDLRRIPSPLIASHLQKIAGAEKIELSPDAAEAIARGAEGGLRDAESMLDQLVAFCGQRIAAVDVLDIFGFTAPETVARMAGHLLAREMSETLAVLDEQSEAGKDLLRLLSELIGHLRNLLVFRVNPSSVQTDVPGSVAAIFEAQAALIPTDRLLELIDGFAAAETRMKWAPNKKLHFEIALIKAVQSLGQATLTEVIDALSALREDTGGAVNGAAPAAAARLELKAPDRPRLERHASRKEDAVPAPEVSAPAVPPGTARPEPAVEEPVPFVVNETPSEPVSPTSNGTPPTAPHDPVQADQRFNETSASAPLDAARIWRDLIPEIRSQRPLITAWVQSGRLLGSEGDTLRIGFAGNQKMDVESLGKPGNRKFLESLLSKLAGRSVGLKLEVFEGDELPAPLIEENEVRRDEPQAEALETRRPVESPSASNSQSAPDPTELFKNDPLIQKALKIFQGEIRSVERPV